MQTKILSSALASLLFAAPVFAETDRYDFYVGTETIHVNPDMTDGKSNTQRTYAGIVFRPNEKLTFNANYGFNINYGESDSTTFSDFDLSASYDFNEHLSVTSEFDFLIVSDVDIDFDSFGVDVRYTF